MKRVNLKMGRSNVVYKENQKAWVHEPIIGYCILYIWKGNPNNAVGDISKPRNLPCPGIHVHPTRL